MDMFIARSRSCRVRNFEKILFPLITIQSPKNLDVSSPWKVVILN